MIIAEDTIQMNVVTSTYIFHFSQAENSLNWKEEKYVFVSVCCKNTLQSRVVQNGWEVKEVKRSLCVNDYKLMK